MEEAQNQSGQRNVLAVTNPLYDHLYTPMPAAPHTEYDHLTSREESAAVECPADDISEELVCRFARQISDGMEHLEKEGVRTFLRAGRSACYIYSGTSLIRTWWCQCNYPDYRGVLSMEVYEYMGESIRSTKAARYNRERSAG